MNNVQPAISCERPFNEVVEPGFWELPIGFGPADPFRSCSSPVLKPFPVVIGKWHPDPKPLTVPGPTQHDRNLLLLPYVMEGETIHGRLPRITDHGPILSLLLGLKFFKRHRDEREVKVIHRDLPVPMQDGEMLILGRVKHEALSMEALQQLLRELLAVVVVFLVTILEATPDF